MSSSKRASTAPTAPRPPVSLAPACVVQDTASLTGTKPIRIGDHTVVHPRAKLVSTYGPVTLGGTCIVSERSTVGLQSLSGASQPEGVVLEDYVVVEVGAVVEARRVGEGSVIEVNAKVGKGVVIGKHCTVGPMCTVEDNEILPDYTVIYGVNSRRLDQSGVDDLKLKMVRRNVDVLKKLIPNSAAKFYK